MLRPPIMPRPRQLLLVPLCAAVVALATASERFAALEAGGRSYRDAVVLSVNDSAIVIRHREGIAQLSLTSLPPDLQARFGYDADKAAERQARLQRIRDAQAKAQAARLAILRSEAEAAEKSTSRDASLAEATRRFGSPPELRQEVDLRERYTEYGLTVRNQWQQPSCAIYSILGALEYQYARYGRGRFDFSEGYLFDATLQTLGLVEARDQWQASESEGEGKTAREDAGFAFPEVLQAIRSHGLVLEGEPREGVDLAVALDRAEFGWRVVPGRDPKMRLSNAIHLLNTETPLVLSLRWPSNRALERTSLLSEQTPRAGAGHAVTLVGYRCETGRLEDVTFIFRNSWGPFWGSGGYGFIRYKYLVENIAEAYLVELM